MIEGTHFRDCRQWSRQVREPQAGETRAVPARDVPAILKESGPERISLLKVAIEGAKAVIFGNSENLVWLDRVDNVAVELHDDSKFGPATEIFERAMANRSFTCSLLSGSDDVVFSRRAGLEEGSPA